MIHHLALHHLLLFLVLHVDVLVLATLWTKTLGTSTSTSFNLHVHVSSAKRSDLSTFHHGQRLQADRSRALDLASRAAGGTTNTTISWPSDASGDYVVRLGVGTPVSTDLYLTLDMSTDLSWLQCVPCLSCSIQQGSIFDPSSSSSYETVSCNSSICRQIPSHNCQQKQCQYLRTSHGGSVTSYGDLCTDNFLLGSQLVPTLVFGCSHSSTPTTNLVSAGMLGLGKGALSLPSQIGNGIFSYCLPDMNDPESLGTLVLGGGDHQSEHGVAHSPLLMGSTDSRMYYINLTAMSIGQPGDDDYTMIPIPITDYTSDAILMLDSITSITTLPTDIYTTVRDLLLERTANIPLSVLTDDEIVAGLDVCYNMSGLDLRSVHIPTFTMYFQGGVNLSLSLDNMLLQDPTQNNVYCLAFSTPVYGTYPTMGSIQQQGFHITVDTRRSVFTARRARNCQT